MSKRPAFGTEYFKKYGKVIPPGYGAYIKGLKKGVQEISRSVKDRNDEKIKTRLERFVVKVVNGEAEVFFKKDDGSLLNIKEHEFRYTKSEWIWFHNKDDWPMMWDTGGGVQKLKLDDGSDLNKFPKIRATNVSNFKIYVTANDYFLSKLPKINTKIGKTDFQISEPYFAAICGAYIATYLSGVSMEHLKFVPGVHPVVTSIMNFHVYFWIRRFVTYPKLIRRYISDLDIIKDHIPSKGVWIKKFYQGVPNLGTFKRSHKSARNVRYARNSRGAIAGIYYDQLTSKKLISQNDFCRFIPDRSDGLTSTGIKLLNESIEAMVYAVLGSQAKTRVSIVGRTAGSLETQDEFREKVRDSILNYNVATWINNMNTAITKTNVVQDLAITPSTWLIPSNMVILKDPVPGYNNLLKTATKDMKFGVNSKVNYTGIPVQPKKVHQESKPHLNTLGEPEPKPIAAVNHQSPSRDLLPIAPVEHQSPKPTVPSANQSPKPIAAVGHQSPSRDLLPIALTTAAASFASFRYVL